MRFVRYGHLDEAGEKGIFQLARFVGKRLPFPLRMKARVRAALLHWRFPQANDFTAHPERATHTDQSSFAISYKPAQANPMHPECCALVPGLVSVVLPVYNQAYLLEEAIQSVLAQTYSNLELIIVNDGSTDDVEAVLDRYLDHPRIRCFTQANQSLPKALSNGFSFARGEFWTWTSADNVMGPRMLELLVDKLRAESQLGLVYADYYAIDDSGSLLQDRSWRAHNRPDPASGEIRLPRSTDALNTVQDNFIGPCFMYRGWIGRCLRDYDPQLGVEDYDYWMRINAFFEASHLGTDDLLYRYRVHDNTLSAQAQEHRIFEKVERLMQYERERASFYRATPEIQADPHGADWLISRGVAAQSIHPLAGEDGARLTEDAGTAELLVLTSETAVSLLGALASMVNPIAVIFSADDQHHQKLQRLLDKPGCVALVSSRIAADRIHLVAPSCPIIDIQSSQSFPALLAFAKNHLFFHETRTPEELKRELPRHLLKPAGRHVLLQVDSFIQGGMENVVIDLAASLQDTGFKVTIGILGKSGDAADKARERKLRVESLPGGSSQENYIAWLKSQQVSLVNAHYSIFGADACRREGIPFIETIHNSYVWLDPETIRQYREADAHVTSYICVSNTAAQYADVVLGLDVAKMRIIANGIDAGNIDAPHFDSNRSSQRQQWQVEADATVFLNVASVMATKAQLPLVKAFAQVVKQRPHARLVLLGSVMEKPYQRAIEKAVEDLKLQKQVIFSGYQRDVAKYYHAADVFVLPSFWEGWSLSLGEAMANGLVCVITDVGSAYEFEGHPRVEIVQPPFGDIAALNFRNLGEYVYSENQDFEKSLATAMDKMAGLPRASIDTHLVTALNASEAYQRYATVFFETCQSF
jgi:glycosyltransferase involved in cell wall biosynthesis